MRLKESGRGLSGVDLEKLKIEYSKIKNQIKQSVVGFGLPKEPGLIAVSKGQSFEKMLALYHLGQRDFGENYVQELLEKVELFLNSGIDDVRFHFLGHLQTNKVRALLPHVRAIHSVDSLKLAEEINKRAEALKKKTSIFLEWNIDEQDSKFGFREHELQLVIDQVRSLSFLDLRGLMILPDPSLPAGSSFARAQQWAMQYLQGYPGKQSLELSMGMSQDFKEAIAHGSSWIRIGTALFGART